MISLDKSCLGRAAGLGFRPLGFRVSGFMGSRFGDFRRGDAKQSFTSRIAGQNARSTRRVAY